MSKTKVDERLRILSLAEIALTDADLEQTEFQVLRTGEFYDHRYGKFSITEATLNALKENFDKKVLGVDVALDVNHEAEKGAKAWINALQVRNGALFAKFKDFTDEAKKLFKEKVFKYFSVEFEPFTKVVDGKKLTIPDVLRGIALTNRPVIKEMQPTFLAEDVEKEIIHHSSMSNAVKVLGEHLMSRGKVTKAEAAAVKVAFATLSEDEQKEAQETVAKVEAEAVKTEEAETKAAEEAAAGDAPDAVKAAEAKRLAETDARELAELREEKKTKMFAERAATVALSESNLTGFAAPDADKVLSFVKTLSEEQFAAFSELTKAVKTVDKARLAELGHAKGGEPEEGTDEEKQLAKVTKLSEEIMKAEKIPAHEAVTRAQKMVFTNK